MRESSKRKWAVSIKHTKQASAVISEIWLGATVKTDHPQHSRLCRSRTANTSPGQHCKGLHRKAVHSFPTITMCFPWSITFCDAPLSRPLSQRALLPVGSSSTSSLVLGGNLTCVESGRKNQQAAEKHHIISGEPLCCLKGCFCGLCKNHFTLTAESSRCLSKTAFTVIWQQWYQDQ